MAFKVNNPLTYTDPGKKLETNKPDPYKTNQRGFSSYSIDKDKKTVEDHKSYDPSKHSKVRNFFESIGPGRAKDRLDTVKSNTPPSVTSKVDAKQQFDKAISTVKKAASLVSGIGSGKASSVKYPEKPKKTGGYVKKGGTSTGNIKDYKVGTQARRDEYTARGWKQDSTTKTKSDSTTQNKPIAEVTKTKGVSIGLKPTKASDVKLSQKPTVKAAPKDNSRKAIKARKTADKKAGVSKSQMRANKAKSKSEAASAKAKKSKNPSYRAQLTAKSERLAKRAKRKGNS